MGRPSRYAPEVRERAVRPVGKLERENGSLWAAITSLAEVPLHFLQYGASVEVGPATLEDDSPTARPLRNAGSRSEPACGVLARERVRPWRSRWTGRIRPRRDRHATDSGPRRGPAGGDARRRASAPPAPPLDASRGRRYPRLMSGHGARGELDPRALERIERRLAAALSARECVRWAYLFGSAARGERFADLDVALMLSDDARGPVPLGMIARDLEEAAAGLAVDVVDAAAAPPALLGSIVREGRLLVDREPAARIEWELEANRQALDIEPWLREFERLRLAALRERARRW